MLFVAILGLVVAGAGAPEGLNADIVGKFEWRSIGPASMGGRVSDFAVLESNPSTFWIGLATGGVLKTTNGGTNWTPLFDEQPCLSIGALAVCQSKPDILWVGTGEANNRNSSGYGDGVYKSEDGGKSWTKMGLEKTFHIERILIDPNNPDIVFVAAMGRLWGENPERGLYRTQDGGKTWTLVLKGNNNRTGCIDVVFGEDGVMFAATYERLRTAWGYEGLGDAGLFRSKDGGKTWTKLTKDLPVPPLGRIGITVCRSKPKVVTVVIESQKGGAGQLFSERSKDGGIFRSEDGGDSWTRMNQLVPRGFYFGQIRTDPKNDKKLYVLGTTGSVSSDGGKTFSGFTRSVHPDIHAFWIDPANGDHLLCGCDGGVYQTVDGGKSWDHLCNFPMAQFYDVAADMREPFHVYGGLQDNGSWGGPSASRTTLGVNNADWYSINGDGDGFYAAVNQENPNIVYAESQNGGLTRLDRSTGLVRRISPTPGEGQPGYRFNWNTPFILSPHNQDVLYLGGNRLFKVTNQGQNYDAVSPDLSKMDPHRITTVGSGAETYGTIVAISESPLKQGTIWCGTDDGNVQVTRDGGKTWVNAGAHLPRKVQDLWVSEVEASHFDPATAYVSVDGHRSDDFEPHVFVTHDYGASWAEVTSNLPKYCPVQSVRESPFAKGVLVIGTTFGVFISSNEGAHWEKITRGLPNVEVDGIYIHPRDMAIVAATHGRGMYVLDNAAPLLQLKPETMNEEMYLFAAPQAWEYIPVPGADVAQREFVARNPPRGIDIYYWVKDEPKKEKPKITITDGAGKVVFEAEGGSFAGLTSTRWDLRAAAGAPGGGGGRRFNPDGGSPGYVRPGVYVVTLKLGSKSLTRNLLVKGDPALSDPGPGTEEYQRRSVDPDEEGEP